MLELALIHVSQSMFSQPSLVERLVYMPVTIAMLQAEKIGAVIYI